MIRRPPRSTRTDTLFPYTTLFRSDRSVRWTICRFGSAATPLLSPHLEEVVEIRIEQDAASYAARSVVVVPDHHPFVAGGLPEELHSVPVDGIPRQNQAAATVESGSGETGSPDRAVDRKRVRVGKRVA